MAFMPEGWEAQAVEAIPKLSALCADSKTQKPPDRAGQ
jgi:hypothetical protein